MKLVINSFILDKVKIPLIVLMFFLILIIVVTLVITKKVIKHDDK